MLSAQEYVFVSSDTIQTVEKIIDIIIDENQRLLLTEEGDILEIEENGQVRVIDTNNKKGFYELKIKGSLPRDYDMDLYQYFCRGDTSYYACYWDWSYSSRIVEIDTLTGDEVMFCYLTGIPSGMVGIDGNLWYLSNRGNGISLLNSRVRCYNEVNGCIPLVFDVPVLDAKGLSIDGNAVFTTYENHSHSLICFRLDTSSYVESNPNIPLSCQLEQNYPNPFNLETKINFQLNRPSRVSLKIYNTKGELVKTVINNINFGIGKHLFNWNGLDDNWKEVSSGIYLYRLVINSLNCQTRSMVLVK